MVTLSRLVGQSKTRPASLFASRAPFILDVLVALISAPAILGLFLLVGFFLGAPVLEYLTLSASAAAQFAPAFAALAIIFSAVLASRIAIRSIDNSRATARLQETLKLVADREFDKEFIEAKDTWSAYRGNPDDTDLAAVLGYFYAVDIVIKLKKLSADVVVFREENEKERDEEIHKLRELASPSSRAEGAPKKRQRRLHLHTQLRREGQLIIAYLNHFELISLAIERNIIDYTFYDYWHGTLVYTTWNRSKSAIQAIRAVHGNSRLFKNWEDMAHRFASEERRKDPKTHEPPEVFDAPPMQIRDLAKITNAFAEKYFLENADIDPPSGAPDARSWWRGR